MKYGITKFAEQHGKKVTGNSYVWNEKEEQADAEQQRKCGISKGDLGFAKTI